MTRPTLAPLDCNAATIKDLRQAYKQRAAPRTDPAPMYAIVIAWVTMDGVRLTGRYVDRLQQVRETVAAPMAKAATWIHGKPNAKDLADAKAHAAKEGCTVFTFTRDEFDNGDPLGMARAAVLAQHAKAVA